MFNEINELQNTLITNFNTLQPLVEEVSKNFMNEGFKKGGKLAFLCQKISIDQSLQSEKEIKELLLVMLMRIQLVTYSYKTVINNLNTILESIQRETTNFQLFMGSMKIVAALIPLSLQKYLSDRLNNFYLESNFKKVLQQKFDEIHIIKP